MIVEINTKIQCPQCYSVMIYMFQGDTDKPETLQGMYCHECEYCGYLISESDFNEVKI